MTGGSDDRQKGLSLLFCEAVNSGAAMGFLAPLTEAKAARYWQEDVFAFLATGLYLWVAEYGGQIVGSVQREPSKKENGLHRAEIQKLLVLKAFRGQGIATKLLAAAEDRARSVGKTLLILDTEAGSVGEIVYTHLGWQKTGEIPQFALSSNGQFPETARFISRAWACR